MWDNQLRQTTRWDTQLRQTGRTTRMVEEALRLHKEGKKVS